MARSPGEPPPEFGDVTQANLANAVTDEDLPRNILARNINEAVKFYAKCDSAPLETPKKVSVFSQVFCLFPLSSSFLSSFSIYLVRVRPHCLPVRGFYSRQHKRTQTTIYEEGTQLCLPSLRPTSKATHTITSPHRCSETPRPNSSPGGRNLGVNRFSTFPAAP